MGIPVVANIVYGPAVIWLAPAGEAAPDETTIGVGVDWGGNWERVGFTKSGAAALYEFETAEADVQELLTTPKRWKTAEKMSVETALAELIADYLQLAVASGTVTETAAGAAQVGYEELQVGGQRVLDEKTVGIEGTFRASDGTEFPIRYIIHRANCMVNGAFEFAKDGQPGIPFRVDALADASKSVGNQLFVFQRVTAPITP
jgi:hypothetical protein